MSVAVKKTADQPVSSVDSPPFPLYRFSVEQFERMVENGIFTAGDRVELLEGWVVKKMTQNPPHAASLDYTHAAMRPLLPPDWHVREQKPITTAESQPEPDLAVVKAPMSRYARRHPRPRDVALAAEVSDTTVLEDRIDKGRIYAQARIPVYWIINLPERRVEVYTQPRGGQDSGYRERRDYGPDESVPLVIAGRELGSIPVSRLLP